MSGIFKAVKSSMCTSIKTAASNNNKFSKSKFLNKDEKKAATEVVKALKKLHKVMTTPLRKN
jgi:hypothetical protein